MTDTDILRAPIPASTDPERLEREARRAELPPIENLSAMTVAEVLSSGRSFTLDSGMGSGRTIFTTRGGAQILIIEADGKLVRGRDFRTDDAASMALLLCLEQAVPGFLRKRFDELEQAKAHISKLTSFYMDNVLWTRASNEAVEFVRKMGSTAGAVPIAPDRPSPPATEYTGVSG